MNGPLRSKQGCWTCRLRRKKCDENRPICSTCQSLSITCHGYGAKPEWMDNGEQEKAMANSIKQIVKHTSRRKGRPMIPQNLFKKRDSERGEAEKPKPGASPESTASSHTAVDERSPRQTSTPAEPSFTVFDISDEESALLMHFLDVVFPLQYPMYNAGLSGGGRGWLLSLLFKNKPLYHASLALSSYHRGMIMLSQRRKMCQKASTTIQEQHLAICLSEFQDRIKTVGTYVAGSCATRGFGILASMVQLVFFDLFAGNNDAWQIHLRAATTTLSDGHKDLSVVLGLLGLDEADEASKYDFGERPPSQQLVIYRFLSGVTMWLDIVSSVTLGKAPRVIHHHSDLIGDVSGIKLEYIMGSQNWAMLQFAQVSALHEYKTQSLHTSGILPIDMFARADIIKAQLQSGFKAHHEEVVKNLDIEFATGESSAFSSERIITAVYALTAVIYLHLVVYGFDLNIEAMDNRICEAMMILHGKSAKGILQTMVCPLYIIGCVAREREKDFFRKAFTTMPVLDPSLEHRARILPLLEETWRRREMGGVWTWEDNLQLSSRTLLLL